MGSVGGRFLTHVDVCCQVFFLWQQRRNLVNTFQAAPYAFNTSLLSDSFSVPVAYITHDATQPVHDITCGSFLCSHERPHSTFVFSSNTL